VVVVVVASPQARLAMAAPVVALLAAAVVVARAVEHAAHQALVVTDLLSFTKYLHNEQGMHHTRRHRPQHYRAGLI
jgi:hypothetical protein